MENDVGLTHVALVVSDLDASIAFYAKYARMVVVHERQDDDVRIAWISDRTRPFVIVIAEGPQMEPALGPFAHLGVGCESRAEVDRLCGLARDEGCLALGPGDSGYPVGYWALIRDPDGHMVELSFGQEVGRRRRRHRRRLRLPLRLRRLRNAQVHGRNARPGCETVRAGHRDAARSLVHDRRNLLERSSSWEA